MILQRKCLLLCLLIFLFGCKEEMNYEPTGETDPDYVVTHAKKNVLKVKFASAPSAEQQLKMFSASSPYTGYKGVDELTRKIGKIKSMERLIPFDSKNEAKHQAYGLDRWYKIEFEEDINLTKAVADYSGLVEIEYVEPDVPLVFEGGLKATGLVVPETRSVASGMPFNDPLLNKQWHYGKGIVETAADADAGIFNAWRVETGKPSVVVAVIDLGVDYKHEDLAANVWTNTKEVAGNGEDDDKNGYIDDIYGFNFVTNKGFIIPCDHGTHVAGTVGAINNNGKGVAGVAGGSGNNDGVKLMICQVSDEWDNAGDYEKAFVYAADNGAVIAQCSWGIMSETASLREVVNYFIKEAGDYEGSLIKGGVVVAASGNDNNDKKTYPAAWDDVVSVAGTNVKRKKASYSNFGDWVKISAPGGDVGDKDDVQVLSTLPNNQYGYMKGTSQATPHVSGIAALIISAKGGTDFTNDKLKEILYSSVVDLSTTAADHALLGKGLLKAEKALCTYNEGAPDAVANLKATAAKRSVTLSWTVPADAVDKVPAIYNIYISKSPITAANLGSAEKRTISVYGTPVGQMMTETIDAGDKNVDYYYAITSADMWGNTSGLSNVVTYKNQNPGTPDAEGGVVLFPNPIGKILTIGWDAWTAGEKEVFIYDLAGREVFHTFVGKDMISGEVEIDLSTLGAGKYVLKFKDANNSIVRNILKVK